MKKTTEVVQRLLPLYQYACTKDQAGKPIRFRFFVGGLFQHLSLFFYVSENGRVSHGVPLMYHYKADASGFSLSLLGGLFKYRSMQNETSHRLFPFYSYRRNKSLGTTRFTALLGLFLSQSGGLQWLTRLWPFFRYERTKADPSSHAPPSEQLSLLWTLHPALSIFRYLSNGMNTFCRLWPLFHYEKQKQLEKQETMRQLCLVYILPGISLLKHQKVGDETENWLWPLVRATSYSKTNRAVDVLWIASKPRLSILRFERDQNKISLWPLCSYSYDASTQRSITNVLWSTLRYQSTPTSYELKMLWRFVWVKKESNGSYLASINPFFYYEHSPDTGSWTAFLGGLIAREKSPTGHSKMAYFWLF